MLHPSYKEIMEKVNENSEEKIICSRYSVVAGTAKRARQISAKEFAIREKQRAEAKNSELPPLPGNRRKALSIAVDEFMEDKVHIVAESSESDD